MGGRVAAIPNTDPAYTPPSAAGGALRAPSRGTTAAPNEQEMAQWRRWARWARWRTHPTLRWKVKHSLLDVTLPVRAAVGAYRAVRQYGSDVARRFGVSRLHQLAQLWRARVWYGLEGASYYRFQLYRPERWRQAGLFVEVHDSELLLRRFLGTVPKESRRIFVDKRQFAAWCAERGLPAPRTVVEVDATQGADATAAGVRLPPKDLFSKPANFSSGRGARWWRYAGDGRYVGDDGRARSGEELLRELAALSAEAQRPILVQEHLRNHRSLAPLTAGGLCTVRMVTLWERGREPRLLIAVYRMPVGSAPADNFDRGGVAAPVDVSTGTLGKALQQHPATIAVPVERHPSTGELIEGRKLPWWPEAVRLVVYAHTAAGSAIPTIGWDVALLEDGPLLVEANNVPCSNLSQTPSGVPLGGTPFVACLNAHFREGFAG